MRSALIGTALAAAVCGVGNGQSFVNWESPHVHPLELTPDGARLLAVNTAGNRLEVFDVSVDGNLVRAGSVSVGLDPVSVRARSADEAWVVNHISDSISVVDLNTMRVSATLGTGDEPADVVFAMGRAFVSVSQLNEVRVFDPGDLSTAPVVIDVEGEDPRAMATDGTNVYVAIFESGNRTTIIDEGTVSAAVNPYPGNPNPAPNDGSGFDPPIAAGLPTPPETSLIVAKAGSNWRDSNGGNWTSAVTWDLHDHDVAVIDAATLALSHVTGVMNANMAVAVNGGGDVVVIGTEATNLTRFEPNLNGSFVRVNGAVINGTTVDSIVDLNDHLDYASPTIDQAQRDLSLGDPRGIDFNGAGDRLYVSGLGSNNLVVYDTALSRLGRVDVGQGPTGVQVHDAAAVVYVLNRFSATISIVDDPALSVGDEVSFYDPTPAVIRNGRPHLYDTHKNSGLGQTSCGSCHLDGRMDQVAWDLGDPSGDMKPFNQVCNGGVINICEDWHPMKGPMATQTLFGILESGPMHWRADREDLAAFNGAFESLLGDDEQLTTQEMDEFEAFVGTLAFPPNPNRNLDGSLKTTLGNGSPTEGDFLFNSVPIDGGALTCVSCHAMPTGTNGTLISGNLLQEAQSMKIPQLQNMYEKTGFSNNSSSNNRGFGFLHDGSADDLVTFLEADVFQFSGGAAGLQERRDLEAFMLSWDTPTHAGVGAQVTTGPFGSDVAFRNELLIIADSGAVELVVKGFVDGASRGWFYTGGGDFQSDRQSETETLASLDGLAGPGTELTWTLVPNGTGTRIGIDRDEDGIFDRDELDDCANPADPADTPGAGGLDAECCTAVCASDPFCCDLGWDGLCVQLSKTVCGCPADVDGNSSVDVDDLVAVILAWGSAEASADIDANGVVNVDDLVAVILAWGDC